MGLMDLLINSGSGSLINKVASSANLDGAGAKNLINMIGGQLLGQTKGKIAGNDDSSMLEEAINGNKFQNRVDNPNLDDKDEGNTILEMITGSKDKSKDIASNISKGSGVNLSVVKNLLPMIAPMLIGSMSKRNSETGDNVSILNIIDMDGDGDVMDDVMGFAKRFF